MVLLDLMLPGADGVTLMESVPELAELPVVFISGYDRDETIARALERGAEGPTSSSRSRAPSSWPGWPAVLRRRGTAGGVRAG